MARRRARSRRSAPRGNSSRSDNSLFITATIIAVLFVIGFFVFGVKDISDKTKIAEHAVNEAVGAADIPRSFIVGQDIKKVKSGNVKFDYITREYKVSDKFSVEDLYGYLKRSVIKEELSVSEPEYVFGRDIKIARFNVFWDKYKVFTLKLRQAPLVQAPEKVAQKTQEKAEEKPQEAKIELKPEVRPEAKPQAQPQKKIEKPKIEEKPKIAEKPKEEKPKPVKPQDVKPPEVVVPKVILQRPQKQKVVGKIAIVLDDWGYNENNLNSLFDINKPMTIAVLPHLAYTKDVALQAHKKGIEIILHLPLEPYGEQNSMEEGTIKVGMSEDDMIGLLNSAITDVPYIRGVSNHQGSKATSDEATMQIIFKRLRQKGLFFLDSYSSSKSICQEAAKSARLRFAQRDVFIDNDEAFASIKDKLYQAYEVAVAKGTCIAIGHDRPLTLYVLKEVMPELEKKGIKFIKVSELAR